MNEDIIRNMLQYIIDNSDYEDLDMYMDIFEDRVSIFKHILEGYFKKVEGRSCCVDKARYVAKLVDKSLKDGKYYPLKETYRDYQNRGGNIGNITELDEVTYWCPTTLDTTEDALKIIFDIVSKN